MPITALLVWLVSLGSALSAHAREPGYDLRIDSSLKGGQLTVIPHITAPAGSRMRYEVISSKEGGGGTSNSSQSGDVSVGSSGSAKLASLTLGVNPKDRYVITVKVFEGGTLVAEDMLQYPKQ